MATTVTTANVVLTSANVANDVEVMLDGDKGWKESFDKLITTIPVPKQEPVLTYLLDLKRLARVVTVTGWFRDTTTTSAATQRTRFISMLSQQGPILLEHLIGTTNVALLGNILKAEISRVHGRMDDLGDGTTPGTDDNRIEVMFTFQVGTFKG